MSPKKDAREDLPMKVGAMAPNYLQAYAEQDDSLQGMEEYRVLSRLKIVQSNVKDEALKQLVGEGGVAMMPNRTPLATVGEPFRIVPLFFFVEWALWKDINDTSAAPAIEARTFDPSSELARKAKNPDTRHVGYGMQKNDGSWEYRKRYVEHLNLPSVILGGEYHLTPVTLSFSRGEHFQGQSFLSAIQMRKVTPQLRAPLWSQVWELHTAKRTKKFSWYGFDFATPDEPYIPQELVEPFQAMHAELQKLHAEGRVRVTLEDEVEDDVEVNSDM